MNSNSRIIANTALQYVKAIITLCISLYSTRLVLHILDVDDFGIYSVIGGVIAMLGFVTNALIITTQRYISYNLPNCTTEHLRKIFANGLFIFICYASALAIVLLLLQDVLFDYALKIPVERIETAQNVYVVTLCIVISTLLSSPYKSLFIAHENMAYIAIVEIIESFIKLALAISLAYVPFDKLMAYAIINLIITIISLLAFSVYAMMKYSECVIIVRRKDLNMAHIKKMIGFAGWTTYGMGCIVTRNQGTAIVLNHFINTVANAAFGIAMQVLSAITFMGSSIINAMNPQLMQAEGDGNRTKMLKMAARQSAFSTGITAITIIPIMAVMPDILSLWLKEVPTFTTLLSRFILLSFLCDQITCGLNSANQAIGKIRNYSLLCYTPKLLFIPTIWIMFKYGSSLIDIMILWVTIELVVALIRIPYMHHTAGLDIKNYVKTVLLPCALHIFVIATVCWLVQLLCNHSIRLFMAILLGCGSGLLSGWLFILNQNEKVYFINLFKKTFRRL